MTVRYYSSVAPETTLSAGITNASTSITVGSVTGFPILYPYTLALDYEGATEELVQVNAAAGTTLTVARAIDGTSAASHNAGARVRHVSSARDFMDSRDHENADDGIHGLASGDVIVGEDAVQTLTNKTLASPTVTGTIAGSPSFTGTWTGTSAGTAQIRLQNTTDVSPTSTQHAFQVGLDSAANIRMDNNEIISANNGVAASLFINPDGGNLSSFNNLAADSTANTYTVNGRVVATQHTSARPGATSTTIASQVTGDANFRWFARADGLLGWGDGTVTDTNLYRPSPNVLQTDDTFQVGGTLTGLANASVAGLTTTGDLTVTGVTTFASTSVPAATFITAAAGWTSATTNTIIKAGYVTTEMNFVRTGGTLTANAAGVVGGAPVLMGTISGSFLPNSTLGIMTVHVGNSLGSGTAQVTSSTGAVNLFTWQASQSIVNTNTVSITLTYPLT